MLLRAIPATRIDSCAVVYLNKLLYHLCSVSFLHLILCSHSGIRYFQCFFSFLSDDTSLDPGGQSFVPEDQL